MDGELTGRRQGQRVEDARVPSRPRNGVPRLALSPDEAATSLGVSRDYLDEHIAPELRWVRRGRRKLVAVREVERWLEREAGLTVGERVRCL